MIASFCYVVLVIFSFTLSIYCKDYSQEEIDVAWKKMTNVKSSYITLGGELGTWPNNVIPFTITDGFSDAQIDQIKNLIHEFENKTCLRWVDKKDLENVQKEQKFKHSPDPTACHTTDLGEENSIRSTVLLGDECLSTNSLMHEIMHSLGFTYEHQRIDRDCYIYVDEIVEHKEPYKIIALDIEIDKWPYDNSSIAYFIRRYNESRNLDKPSKERWYKEQGDIKYEGQLTDVDVMKVNHRFCEGPHYCDVYPNVCHQSEEEEVQKGCKELYLGLATGKFIPSNQ